VESVAIVEGFDGDCFLQRRRADDVNSARSAHRVDDNSRFEVALKIDGNMLPIAPAALVRQCTRWFDPVVGWLFDVNDVCTQKCPLLASAGHDCPHTLTGNRVAHEHDLTVEASDTLTSGNRVAYINRDDVADGRWACFGIRGELTW